MGRVDRYMLSQLLLLFGFFALVLVALFWINRAVVLFDRLIGDGQSALVFLEFASLSLPKLITTVLPIAAFAGSVYVTNRMAGEAELTVLKATGTSPWNLAKPVFLFGLCVAVMMSALTHFLVPTAQAQLKQRETEISSNMSSRLLTEGTFLHPNKKVTFYTREITADGVLRDVFLSDRRSPSEGVIYTAAEAYLLRSSAGTSLIMVDGQAQRLGNEDNRLATARFRDFSFDISSLVNRSTSTQLTVSNMVTPTLIANWSALAALTGAAPGAIAEELHARFAGPLFCIVAAMIGFSTLLLGGYSRFGVWREILLAFALLIAIDGFSGTLTDPVRNDAAKWPLIYLPSTLGALLVLAMLWQASHANWLRRMRKRRRGVQA